MGTLALFLQIVFLSPQLFQNKNFLKRQHNEWKPQCEMFAKDSESESVNDLYRLIREISTIR